MRASSALPGRLIHHEAHEEHEANPKTDRAIPFVTFVFFVVGTWVVFHHKAPEG